jgi:decaprenylphospho-beta-D-erythro-pentofuranosid-2-ulose 2-reductase
VPVIRPKRIEQTEPPLQRILLLGGTSEIGLAILRALPLGPDCDVLLAGRSLNQLARAGKQLPGRVRVLPFDATAFTEHQAFANRVFADGGVDLVICAAGILVPQPQLDHDPELAANLIGTNLTGHVSVLLAIAQHMRRTDRGTIAVLSSIAAVRPRRANFVYGAAKAGLDAFARGLTDQLHNTSVRVILVRPGFVIGRMTHGMSAAPLATTLERVGAAVASSPTRGTTVIWIPRTLIFVAWAMRLLPRSVWRRLPR